MPKIKFWGVRGSIPTPGPDTVRYGGNTACIELRFGDSLFILDAGSGLRSLGQELIKSDHPVNACIFISHVHWDHIQGIPFFTPAFNPKNKFVFYGAEESDKNLKKVIAQQMDPVYFPVELSDMRSDIEFRSLSESAYIIEGIRVETMYVNHPGNALGYKFLFSDKTLVYISDNEPFNYAAESLKEEALLGEDGSQKLIDFISNADLLIHDAQYTKEEYLSKITWGHSPVDYTVDIAMKGKVKKLILFHHDPLHDDNKVDSMLEYARKINHSNLDIIAARENLEIEF